MTRPAVCRDCKARIIWTITANGKKLPVNAWTSSAGNVVLLDAPSAAVVHSRVLEKGEEFDGPRYLPHFATCRVRKAKAKR